MMYQSHTMTIPESSDDDMSKQTNDKDDDDNDTSKSVSQRKDAVIAKNESRTVLGMKMVVFGVLVSATVGVALLVYFYITNSETRQMEEQFSEHANKVLEGIGSSLDSTFGSLDSLATGLVSYAKASNQTWPYVTVPDFAQRVAKTLPFSKSMSIALNPIVYPETRGEWEEYSIGPQAVEDVENSLTIMENDPNYHGAIFTEYTMNSTIYGDFGDVPYNTT